MCYNPPVFDFEICGVKRQLPFVKIKDDMALASFVIASMRAVTEEMCGVF